MKLYLLWDGPIRNQRPRSKTAVLASSLEINIAPATTDTAPWPWGLEEHARMGLGVHHLRLIGNIKSVPIGRD